MPGLPCRFGRHLGFAKVLPANKGRAMSVIAFVTIGAIGHVYNCLAIAQELVQRGHGVHFLTPVERAPAIAKTGATHVPIPTVLSESGASRHMDGFDLPDVPATLARETVATIRDIRRHLERIEPDVVVYDSYTFGGALAAESLGVPAVRKNGTFALRPWFNYFQETERGGLPGRLTTPESLAEFDRLMKPVFHDCSLPPRSFHELITEEPALEIVFLSRSFHPRAEDFGTNVLFVGPVSSPASRIEDWEARLPRPEPDRDLVFVSMGSVFSHQPALYYNCLEAFDGWNVRVVLSVGRTFNSDFWTDVPENISVHPWVPQLDVLRNSRAFVTHAGAGSVMEAVSFGVPMLAVPQFPEQLLLAQRVRDLGCGLLLPREEVCVSSLRTLVERILTDPSYRNRAASLGREATADGGVGRACDAIQDFADRSSRGGSQCSLHGQGAPAPSPSRGGNSHG